MKTRSFFSLKTLGALAAAWCALGLQAQELSLTVTDLPISKNAKKSGMYVQTVHTTEDQLAMFISYDVKKDLGFDVITFDKSGKVVRSAEELASSGAASKYGITIPEPGKVSVPGAGREVVAVVGSIGAVGKMKLRKGTFEPKYASSVDYSTFGMYSVTTYTPVLRGFKFEEREEVKTDLSVNILTLFPKDEEIERDYNIIEGMVTGVAGYIPANSSAAFIGTIIEKVDIKNPSEYANNRLIHGVLDGKSLSFTKETVTVFPYAHLKVTNGVTAEGNRAVLLAANRVATTYAPQRQWAPSSPKLMALVSIDKAGNLVDNVSWESASTRGSFALGAAKGSTYVLGLINNSHDGYYRMDLGKLTDLQVTKISKGAVEYNKTFSLEELGAKLVGKGKLKLNGTIWCSGFTDLPNGDLMAFFASPTEYFMVQFTSGGELKATYLAERVPGKELLHLDNLVHIQGDDVFVVFREQSPAIAQGVTKSFGRNATSYVKDVNFTRIDEVMAYASVVKISPKAQTISSPVSTGSDVILGSYPLIDRDGGGLLMPARDAKGNYKIISVQ